MLVCAAAFLTCTSTQTKRETVEMRDLVPDETSGWKAQKEVEVYDRETIFDYINGAGEIYLMYDFRQVMVLRLSKSDQPNILVEVFDMGSSEDAFGIFSHAHEGEELDIGQSSEYRGGVLCFWKANYFVCVYSDRETPQTKQAVFSLAEEIARRIKLVGDKPALLCYLPEQGLQDKSIRFFHKHTSLNYHYFLASENVLQLSQYTQAVLARYYPGQSIFLCVLYRNKEQAQSALNNFLGVYLPMAKQSGIAPIDDGKWVAAKSKGPFILVVFDAPTEDDALSLLEAAENKLPDSPSKQGENR